jgi:hypothetical protein
MVARDVLERGSVRECHCLLNDSNRAIISLMRDSHGECWLGRTNLYAETRGQPVLWKWDGELVRDFDCSFVVPCYDEELVRLILDRDAAPYTGTLDDCGRVLAIHGRIGVLGGVQLVWS